MFGPLIMIMLFWTFMIIFGHFSLGYPYYIVCCRECALWMVSAIYIIVRAYYYWLSAIHHCQNIILLFVISHTSLSEHHITIGYQPYITVRTSYYYWLSAIHHYQNIILLLVTAIHHCQMTILLLVISHTSLSDDHITIRYQPYITVRTSYYY